MLAGVSKIIDRALGLDLQDYKLRAACNLLSNRPVKIEPLSFVTSLYDRIEANWDRSTSRGKSLWRWEAMQYIASENDSPEKTLEKAIVNCSGTWVNQIADSGACR